MEASSLSNEPFNLSADEIDELWRTVRDSGAYPDLDTVAASNGDVYYFSTEYLTPPTPSRSQSGTPSSATCFCKRYRARSAYLH